MDKNVRRKDGRTDINN